MIANTPLYYALTAAQTRVVSSLVASDQATSVSKTTRLCRSVFQIFVRRERGVFTADQSFCVVQLVVESSLTVQPLDPCISGSPSSSPPPPIPGWRGPCRHLFRGLRGRCPAIPWGSACCSLLFPPCVEFYSEFLRRGFCFCHLA